MTTDYLEGLLHKEHKGSVNYVNEVYNAIERIRDEYSSRSQNPMLRNLKKIKEGVEGVKGLAKALIGRQDALQEGDHPNPSFLIFLDYSSETPGYTRFISNGEYTHKGVIYHGQDFTGNNLYKMLKKLMHIDGAVLVGEDKRIEKVRAIISTPKLEDTMKDFPGTYYDEGSHYKTLGFKDPVSTRHISAALGSLYMPQTLAITLSAETGNIRIYNKGRIIHSTVPSEIYSERAKYVELPEIGFKKDPDMALEAA